MPIAQLGERINIFNQVGEADEIPAARLPLGEFEAKLPAVVKNKTLPLILICKSGARARRAVGIARKLGYEQAQALAGEIAAGPGFANGITKTMLHQEWNMGVDQAVEAEAQAQAICMLTGDFERAYQAFVDKRKPVFEGN